MHALMRLAYCARVHAYVHTHKLMHGVSTRTRMHFQGSEGMETEAPKPLSHGWPKRCKYCQKIFHHPPALTAHEKVHKRSAKDLG